MDIFKNYEAAFPSVDVFGPLGERIEGQKGLTKRDYFTGVAFAAILQNEKLMTEMGDSAYPLETVVAEAAERFADALLKQLNREKGKP